MKTIFIAFSCIVSLLVVECTSTKSTIKNIDNTAPIPKLSKQNTFVITEYSKDKKYGYDPDYPINVFYINTKNENLNAERYLNALVGPNNEEIVFIKKESCCPFSSKNTNVGAGFLDKYEIVWKGQKEPIYLYLNIYERGFLAAPIGLNIKKMNN
jgi:hypothetical protein